MCSILNTTIHLPWFRIRLKHILIRTKLQWFADWPSIKFEGKQPFFFLFQIQELWYKNCFLFLLAKRKRNQGGVSTLLVHTNHEWKYKLNLHYKIHSKTCKESLWVSVLPCFPLLFPTKKKILWICWWFGESFKFPIWFSLFFLSQSRIAKVTFSARLMLPEGALTVHVWLSDTSHNAHFKLWELKGFNNVYCLVRVLLFCLLLLSSLLFNP